MRKTILYLVIAALLAVSIPFYVERQRRVELLDEGRKASVALAATGNEVKFRWEFRSCPAENPAIYADWTHRLADAKTQAALISTKLGADPEAELFSQSVLNQELLISERHLTCLKMQGKVLDRLAARRSVAN